MGVRLIAIDRPGYGLSTPNPQQTFKTVADDIASIADVLDLGEKIWLLGTPVEDFTDLERKAALAELAGRTRLMFLVMRNAPQWMIYAYVRPMVVRQAETGWIEDCKKQMFPPDLRNLVLVNGLMYRDSIKAVKQNGFGMAQGLQLIISN